MNKDTVYQVRQLSGEAMQGRRSIMEVANALSGLLTTEPKIRLEILTMLYEIMSTGQIVASQQYHQGWESGIDYSIDKMMQAQDLSEFPEDSDIPF